MDPHLSSRNLSSPKLVSSMGIRAHVGWLSPLRPQKSLLFSGIMYRSAAIASPPLSARLWRNIFWAPLEWFKLVWRSLLVIYLIDRLKFLHLHSLNYRRPMAVLHLHPLSNRRRPAAISHWLLYGFLGTSFHFLGCITAFATKFYSAGLPNSLQVGHFSFCQHSLVLWLIPPHL